MFNWPSDNRRKPTVLRGHEFVLDQIVAYYADIFTNICLKRPKVNKKEAVDWQFKTNKIIP